MILLRYGIVTNRWSRDYYRKDLECKLKKLECPCMMEIRHPGLLTVKASMRSVFWKDLTNIVLTTEDIWDTQLQEALDILKAKHSFEYGAPKWLLTEIKNASY